MTEHEEDHHRADDSLLRKVAVGVLIAIVIQSGSGIYMFGTLSNQVANNTKSITAAMDMLEKQSAASNSLIRVVTLVEGLTTSVNRVADRLELVATEQNRRALIIDRADRYMEKNGAQ